MITINKNLITKPSSHSLDNSLRKIWRSLLSNSTNYISGKTISLIGKLEEFRWKKILYITDIPKTDEIFTYTSKHELRTLYELASTCPQDAVALEIGSHLGASSCYIAAGLKQKNGHLFCVDTWNNETMPEGEQNTFAEFQKNTNGVKQQITPVRKRSEDVNACDINVPLDFVFIDGDHSYKAVKNDYEKISPWIVGGGILAFHDCIYFEGVSRIIGEALASGAWQVGGKVENLLWLRKIAKGCLEFDYPL